MRYVMMICGPESNWEGEHVEELMATVGAWWEKWHAAGVVIQGGAELQPVATAKTVRRGADGKAMVTDGPYIELKDVVGGFMLLEADSMDEAVACAATWPGIEAVGDQVEVRPTTGR
ncbi:YciI family protein [Asanoa sp. WMMD1127]|uniref:YciI family protein n=1 Tax=Asanoa sp. WMMD1127 TaxID=3016107 RepID=UPI002416994E|nr:YciI family protein [Asanoa sp. WMMD1127]MDG4826052.1 YciI family protein [Asanoa sp. WMMD1127]